MEFVKPPEQATINVLLYGPPKVGKSIGAGSAPGPVLYINAEQPNATRLVHKRHGDKIKEVRLSGLQTLVEAMGDVQQNQGKWGSVVLDTVGETYRRVLDDASGAALDPKIQDYGHTGTYVERFCRGMCEQPVNFVVVAHEVSLRDDESGSFERLPQTGTSNPALGAKLMGMVDVVGYCNVAQQEGKDALSYLATFQNVRGRRGGDRFNTLGAFRSVDISEWVALVNGNERGSE